MADSSTQREASVSRQRLAFNLSVIAAAYIALEFGYTTIPGLAVAAVMIATSAPKLYAYHVHRRPLPMPGAHWTGIALGLTLLAALALKAYFDGLQSI